MTGSVYLTRPDGTGLAGAGGTIYLLRSSEGLRTALSEVCRLHQDDLQAVEDSLERFRKLVSDTIHAPTDDPWTAYWAHETSVRDSKRTERRTAAFRSRARLQQVLASAVVDSVVTGTPPAYEFTGLAAGEYVLFSELVLGRIRYVWWQPVHLRAGIVLTQSLYGTVSMLDHVYCSSRRDASD